MRFLLVGNYGARNVGDEALRQYFVTRYPEVEWIVLSASPADGEVPRLPLGLRSFLGTAWWKTLGAYRRCDGLVFGGGSLFTDTESTKACMIWGWHAWVASIFGKPIYLAFQGVGPLRSSVAKRCARFVLRHARFVSVRDPESVAVVRSLAPNTKVVHTFDPVFSLQLEKKEGVRAQKMLSIIPRHNSGESFFLKALELQKRGDFEVVQILSMEDSPGDKAATDRLQKDLSGTVHQIQDWGQLLSLLAGSSLVFSERYHGALAAIRLGIPVEIFPQKPGDKLDALRRRLAESSADDVALRMLAEIRVGEEALRTALRIQA